jgi:hypothetical protein
LSFQARRVVDSLTSLSAKLVYDSPWPNGYSASLRVVRQRALYSWLSSAWGAGRPVVR